MSFTNPTLLLLLAVPAILLTWAWQRRGWGIAMPFDHQSHPSRRWLRWLLSGFESLPAIVLAGMILILAGPQILKRPTNGESEAGIINRVMPAVRLIDRLVANRAGLSLVAVARK